MKNKRIMRKTGLSLGIILLFLPGIMAQSWPWADLFTASGEVKTVDIQIRGDQEVYVSGVWSGGGPLSYKTNTLNSLGNQDAFIARLDNDGNLLWMLGVGGADNDEEISGIRIHSNGDLYVVGAFRSSSATIQSINPSGNVTLINSTPGKWETFVSKYKSNGTLVWSKRLFWGSDNDRLQDIDFKNNLMVIIGNYRSNPLNYDNGGGGGTLPKTGTKNLFIATYDTAGNYQMIKRFIPTVTSSAFRKVHPCIYGGYYVTGDLPGTLQNGSGTPLFTASSGDVSNSDVMAMRVDDNLDFLWGRTGGGTGFDHVNYSTVSRYGNLYISGKTESNPTIFDSTATRQSAPLPALGGPDFYIAKYSSSGNLQWVRRNGTAYEDNAYGLAIFQELVQFAGIFGAPVVINQDTLDCGTPGDVNTGFAIFDRYGNEVGGQEICGDGRDEGLGVAYDQDGHTYVIGTSNSNTLQAGDISLNNPNPGVYMGFLAHYEYAFSVSKTLVHDISCNGGNDGEIILTPYFGVYPYTYDWSHDALLNDSIATGLAAGDYTVTVTDARDSSETLQITLTEPDPITINAVQTNISCSGGTNGAIDITVSGGTPSYNYTWTGPGVSTSSEDQTNLAPGTFSVTVTDGNGCIASDNFTLTEPQSMNFLGTTKTDVTPPACDGAIDLQVNGGTPPYSYSWTGPAGFTSGVEDLTGLCDEGGYQVDITDANLCPADTTVYIGLVFYAYICDQTDVSCNGGNDGCARVCVANSAGNLSYEWRTFPGGVLIGTTDEICNLTAGTYTVTVTDDSNPPGSPSTVQVEILEPSNALSISNYNPSDVTCNGACDGEIELSISGGTPPYSYSWTGPGGFTSSSRNIANLCPGNYSVTVTDAKGCQVSQNNIPIAEPSVITCNLVSTTNILCNGQQTGELCVVVSGGTGTLNVLWDDPAAQTTLCARFLDAGDYYITVFDDNGCSKRFGPYTVSQPNPISILAQVDAVSCFGDCDGSMIISTFGGIAPYSYVWYDGSNNIIGTSKDLTGACAGTYRLVVTDVNNCVEEYSGEISQPTVLSVVSEDYTDPVCAEACDGTITLIAGGGTPPYEYSVDDGTNWQSGGDFTALCEGNYQVKVRDNNLCETSGSLITLTDPLGITIIDEDATNVTCNGLTDGTITVSATGNEPLEYSIDGGTNYQSSNVFTGLSTGNYEIWVRDAAGCEKQGGTHAITEPAVLGIAAAVNGTTVTAQASGGISPYVYILRNPTDSIDSNGDGVFSGLSAGCYVVEVTDQNACGPVSSDEVCIYSFELFDAITPNDDGVNDLWVIYGSFEYPGMIVKIYNAWGGMVFESEPGYPIPWDGKANGRILPAGTYYYIIDLNGDGSNIMKGTVNIIK